MLRKLCSLWAVCFFLFPITSFAQLHLSQKSVPLSISQAERNYSSSTLLTPLPSERWVGYWDGDSTQLGMVGVEQVPMTYHLAIGYPAGSELMKNQTIEGLRFRLANSPFIQEVKVWMSHQLPVSAETADICCLSLPDASAINEVRFPQPYKVDSTSTVYIGYSFQIKEGHSDNEKYPIIYSTQSPTPNAFLLKLGGRGQKWADYAGSGFGPLALHVLVSGEMKAVDVSSESELGETVTLKEGCTIPLVLRNYGAEGVENLTVSVNTGDVVTEQEIQLPQKVSGIGELFEVHAKVTVPQAPAKYDCVATVTQVNGQALPQEVTANGEIYVVSRQVPHKVFLEEFTGMWCGNCPRGMVGLEKLHQMYGDSVVLVAAHSNDALECKDYQDFMQQTVASFPLAHLDRTMFAVDPYYGQGGVFGINDCVKSLMQELPIADVKAVPSLHNDTLSATAEVEFLFDGQSTDYSVGYILTEDGMSKTSWFQTNYLSGNQELLQEDTLFAPWVEAGHKRGGVTYNEVAIAAKGIMNGINGSLSTSFEAGSVQKHSVHFDLNRYKKIQNRGHLNLIVLLFDTRTGRVINADQKRVSLVTGIHPEEAVTPMLVGRFSLDGRQLLQPQKGINILKYNDGTVRKVIMK